MTSGPSTPHHHYHIDTTAHAPTSILVIGAGVFGLSTAHSLLSNPRYSQTKICIVDRYVGPPTPADTIATAEPTTTTTDSHEAHDSERGDADEEDGTAEDDKNKKKGSTAGGNSQTPRPQQERRQWRHIAANPSFPRPTNVTASHDTSRIVRCDYADEAYAELGARARGRWRAGWPDDALLLPASSSSAPSCIDHDDDGDGVSEGERQRRRQQGKQEFYHETGLILVASGDGDNPHGEEYVRKSFENAMRLQGGNRTEKEGDGDVVPLKTTNDLEGRAPYDFSPFVSREEKSGRSKADLEEGQEPEREGMLGYVNWRSGWADATGAMTALGQQVLRIGGDRVRWMSGRVERLLLNAAAVVEGAVLDKGERLCADITLVAAGAWSAALLPHLLGPRVRARGQALAYLRLKPDEAARLAGKPVLLDMATGMFVMPPPLPSSSPPPPSSSSPPLSSSSPSSAKDSAVFLKLARHGWGYENWVDVPCDEEDGGGGGGCQTRRVSLPASDFAALPLEARDSFRRFLQKIFKPSADDALASVHSREFEVARICWYADTPTGDFLVDRAPGYGGRLFVATGGSGHAFKFAPLIGDLVVKKLEGKLESPGGSDVEQYEKALAGKWRWREGEEVSEDAWRGSADGSRGGTRGMQWREEIEKK